VWQGSADKAPEGQGVVPDSVACASQDSQQCSFVHVDESHFPSFAHILHLELMSVQAWSQQLSLSFPSISLEPFFFVQPAGHEKLWQLAWAFLAW
jgi:hypothetical protein